MISMVCLPTAALLPTVTPMRLTGFEAVWPSLRPELAKACLASKMFLDWSTVTAPYRFRRSEEHTSELQSLMRISYAVFCLKKKTEELNPYHYSDNNKQYTSTYNSHSL